MGTLHLDAVVAFFVLVGLGAFIYYSPDVGMEDKKPENKKKNPLRKV